VNPFKGSFTKPGNARKIKANRSMNCIRSVWGFSCQSPGLNRTAYAAGLPDQGKQQDEFTRVKFRRAIITKKYFAQSPVVLEAAVLLASFALPSHLDNYALGVQSLAAALQL